MAETAIPKSPSGTATPGRSLPRPLERFLRTESAGGAALLLCTVVALVWANSPWKASYATVWETEISLRLGDLVRTEDVRHLVNEALMAVFFLVVGLEVKQELVAGQLRRWRTAALPVIAAAGGMLVPALLYLSVNLGSDTSRGWGIPMATDIAFAVGVLALLGRGLPGSLKAFLLTLAVADDIGAIVIIAVFYSEGIEWAGLLAAAVLLGGVVGLRKLRVFWAPGYVILGIAVWVAFYESGVHATLAGVVLGLTAPGRPLAPEAVAEDWSADLAHEPSPDDLRTMTRLAKATVAVTERLQHNLHPVTSYLVVPAFALANAGVALDLGSLDSSTTRSVAIGVAAGLVVGKLVGIAASSWLAVRVGLGRLPDGVRWSHVVGVASLAGIGYTVSLLIADLAFTDEALTRAAKLGILAASALAALTGGFILHLASRRSP